MMLECEDGSGRFLLSAMSSVEKHFILPVGV